MPPRKSRFQAKVDRRDLFKHPVLSSGIEYAQELEWIFTAVWAHLSPPDFEALPGLEQSRLVAAYRTQQRIEGVQAYKQAQKAKRAATRKK